MRERCWSTGAEQKCISLRVNRNGAVIRKFKMTIEKGSLKNLL